MTKRLSPYWITFILGSVWLLIVAIRSPDAQFLDEVGHLLVSRNAWRYPTFFLDVWGRPFNTLIYAIPALGGIALARWLSFAMALMTVWLTTQIAEKWGIKHLWLIPLLLFFQPWFTEWMYTANTMTPLSLLIVGGIYFWMNGRWDLASLMFGLLPLTRHEGIVLMAIWAGYCLIRRKPLAIGISIMPMVVYNLLYYATFGVFASGNLFNLQPTTFYGAGDWFHYLPDIIQGVGLIMLPISLLGIPAILKHPMRVIFVPYTIYLLVHIVIYRFGLFASGGYGAFLIPLAPAFAILVAVGITEIIEKTSRRRRNQVWVAILGAIVFYSILTTHVHPYTPRTRGLMDASAWIKANEPDATVLSSHVWFIYFHDLAWSTRRDDGFVRTPIELDALPIGTLIVWEGHFSERFGINYDYLSGANEWQTLQEFSTGDNLVALFKKVE